MTTHLHDRLNESPLLVAEGFVFELERSCLLQAGAFVPTVVLERPQAVRDLTDRFIDSGSDVVLALTYYTNADKLRLLGMEGRLEQINRAALTIATDAAADAAARYGRPYLVAGNICNTYEFEDFQDVERYRRQVLPDIGGRSAGREKRESISSSARPTIVSRRRGSTSGSSRTRGWRR